MTLRVVALRRARLFSPGHVSHDWLILKETADRLAALGHDVRFLDEEQFDATPQRGDLVLNMCQGPEANGRLCAAEGEGVVFVNRPSAALDCLRYRLLPKLQQAGVPIPESAVVGPRRTHCPRARGPRRGSSARTSTRPAPATS